MSNASVRHRSRTRRSWSGPEVTAQATAAPPGQLELDLVAVSFLALGQVLTAQQPEPTCSEVTGVIAAAHTHWPTDVGDSVADI